MTPEERRVLQDALQSLDVTVVDDHTYTSSRLIVLDGQVDLYNYRAIGKMILGKRMLAELLGCPHYHLLPGENYDEDDAIEDLCRYITPSTFDTPLTNKEKQFLINTVLIVLDGIGGLGDGDQACIRVATRRIAEVAGYPDLGRYRLMMEDEVKPLSFVDYQPFVESD